MNFFKKEASPEVVLVPPLFERDHRGRSRMAKSSYDYQFCKPQLKWLFNDYLWDCATSLLRFSPAEDRRMTVKARLGTLLDSPGSGSSGGFALVPSHCHFTSSRACLSVCRLLRLPSASLRKVDLDAHRCNIASFSA